MGWVCFLMGRPEEDGSRRRHFVVAGGVVVFGLVMLVVLVGSLFDVEEVEERVRSPQQFGWYSPRGIRSEKPSVAFVGFTSREGSSWFMNLLRATQRISEDGKICVLGFEPLDTDVEPHDLVDSKELVSLQREARQKFYMELTTLDTSTKQRYLAWVARLNEILKRGYFFHLDIGETCDFRSRVFIFKGRINQHFGVDTPESSIFLQTFSEKFRAMENSRIIVLQRNRVLNRALSNVSGQFLLDEAETEEERQEILDRMTHMQVRIRYMESRALQYIMRNEQVANVARWIQVPSLTVHYENLVYEYKQEMDEVMRFLRVPYEYDLEDLKDYGRYEKASPERLCEKVANYKEFCEYFNQTQFAGYLDESCDTKCEPQ